jgi:hypothetical protein
LIHPIYNVIDIPGTVNAGLFNEPPFLPIPSHVRSTNADGILPLFANFERNPILPSDDRGKNLYPHSTVGRNVAGVYPFSEFRSSQTEGFTGVGR